MRWITGQSIYNLVRRSSCAQAASLRKEILWWRQFAGGLELPVGRHYPSRKGQRSTNPSFDTYLWSVDGELPWTGHLHHVHSVWALTAPFLWKSLGQFSADCNINAPSHNPPRFQPSYWTSARNDPSSRDLYFNKGLRNFLKLQNQPILNKQTKKNENHLLYHSLPTNYILWGNHCS